MSDKEPNEDTEPGIGLLLSPETNSISHILRPHKTGHNTGQPQDLVHKLVCPILGSHPTVEHVRYRGSV